jgi:hypothetical protein
MNIENSGENLPRRVIYKFNENESEEFLTCNYTLIKINEAFIMKNSSSSQTAQSRGLFS